MTADNHETQGSTSAAEEHHQDEQQQQPGATLKDNVLSYIGTIFMVIVASSIARAGAMGGGEDMGKALMLIVALGLIIGFRRQLWKGIKYVWYNA